MTHSFTLYNPSLFKLDTPGSFTLHYLSDKLHDLSQVLLLLQDLLGLGAKGHKLGEVFVVILIQGARVLAVADQPVYGREVLPLSQLLIQTPEHLRNKTTQPLITSITRF